MIIEQLRVKAMLKRVREHREALKSLPIEKAEKERELFELLDNTEGYLYKIAKNMEVT